ncbi:MAG TPA: hypothetical protein VFW42_00945 [Fluviicoccus sp.]|nr:hypothetical protein [Fluviicoccus sp.]
MSKQERRPIAFLSCSLRPEDEEFVNFVARLCRHFGFEPTGTVGKYQAAPEPIWKQMIDGVKSCDCVVLAATPRYIQQDVNNSSSAGRGISEMLHVEMGMAAIENKPVLVFVQKGTNVGSFLSQYVQYIEIDMRSKADINRKAPLIANYFRSAFSIIERNWSEKSKSDLFKASAAVLATIGAINVLDALFSDKK